MTTPLLICKLPGSRPTACERVVPCVVAKFPTIGNRQLILEDVNNVECEAERLAKALWSYIRGHLRHGGNAKPCGSEPSHSDASRAGAIYQRAIAKLNGHRTDSTMEARAK